MAAKEEKKNSMELDVFRSEFRRLQIVYTAGRGLLKKKNN